MRKTTYDARIHQFKVTDDAILDPLNWKSSFKKFIIEEMKKKDKVGVSMDLFTKLPVKIVPKFWFYEASRLQVYILYRLEHESDFRSKVLGTNDSSKLNQFRIRIHEIYTHTEDKFHELSENHQAAGFEILEDIKYSGRSAWSIESHDENRIIYIPNPPYSIEIYSILFHYEDTPENEFDFAILEYYNKLTEEGTVNQRTRLEYTYKFVEDCTKRSLKLSRK